MLLKNALPTSYGTLAWVSSCSFLPIELISGTAVAPEQGIGLDLLAGLEVQDHTVVHAFDAVVVFVVANRDVVVAEVVAQRLGNFRVEEAQQLTAVVHQLNQHTQAAEDRRVF